MTDLEERIDEFLDDRRAPVEEARLPRPDRMPKPLRHFLEDLDPVYVEDIPENGEWTRETVDLGEFLEDVVGRRFVDELGGVLEDLVDARGKPEEMNGVTLDMDELAKKLEPHIEKWRRRLDDLESMDLGLDPTENVDELREEAWADAKWEVVRRLRKALVEASEEIRRDLPSRSDAERFGVRGSGPPF